MLSAVRSATTTVRAAGNQAAGLFAAAKGVARKAGSAEALVGGSRALSHHAPGSTSVGILAASVYVPKRFVEMSELEQVDGARAGKDLTGKYTKGLGQDQMGFVSDVEDINSILMNALDKLLLDYEIDPKEIGRVEVGTETFVDKSKSSKTHLHALLGDNTDIEGATVMNACYGGTAALLNSAAWVESSVWDGRYAVVVTGDIAVYEPGPARPTGGCGAVAFLVGPDAPLAMIPRRHTHSSDVTDFYKPHPMSEYPVVDGKLSQTCYLRALDSAYNGMVDRTAKGSDAVLTLRDMGANWLFHSPYNKLVQQSLRRLHLLDAARFVAHGKPVPESHAALAEWAAALQTPEGVVKSYTDRDLDKILSQVDPAAYADLVADGDWISKRIGNSYAAALHVNTCALIEERGQDLLDQNVMAFSYGSGAIATQFGYTGREPLHGRFSLERMQETLRARDTLDARVKASVDEFEASLSQRESTYGRADFVPLGSQDDVWQGCWRLKQVKADGSRVYDRS
jgi:hydroxymethylglutaryl-CoA synthase